MKYQPGARLQAETRSATARLPEFPLQVLPLWMRAWAEAQAEALQLPVEVPALLSLAVWATACAGRCTVKVRDGWVEPTNLFLLVAVPRGRRTSALFGAATRPLLEHERAVAHARALRAPVNGAARRGLRLVEPGPQYDDAPAQAAPPPLAPAIDPPPRLFIRDATADVLGALLALNGGRLAILGDQGQLAESLVASSPGELDALMSGYSGATLAVDGMGPERVYVERPALTLGLLADPAVLRRLVTHRSDVLSRFLVAAPPTITSPRQLRPTPVPDEVRIAYEARITALVEALAENKPEAFVLTFTDAARRRLLAFEAEVTAMLGSDRRVASDASGNRLVGNVVRIAGLLQLATVAQANDDDDDDLGDWLGDMGTQPAPGEIDEETVVGAISIGRYASAHAIIAFRSVPR